MDGVFLYVGLLVVDWCGGVKCINIVGNYWRDVGFYY